MNPRDIMNDAIHNFHPNYQQYTQYQSSTKSNSGTNNTQGGTGVGSKSDAASNQVASPQGANNGNQDHNVSGITNMGSTIEPEDASRAGRRSNNQPSRQIQTISQNYTEKTTLLSSDDEFQ